MIIYTCLKYAIKELAILMRTLKRKFEEKKKIADSETL